MSCGRARTSCRHTTSAPEATSHGVNPRLTAARIPLTLNAATRSTGKVLLTGGKTQRPGPFAEHRRGPTGTRKRSALQASLQVFVQRAEEFLGGQVGLIRADQTGQVLGHLAGFDRLDDDVLEGFGEGGDLRGAVQGAAVLEP